MLNGNVAEITVNGQFLSNATSNGSIFTNHQSLFQGSANHTVISLFVSQSNVKATQQLPSDFDVSLFSMSWTPVWCILFGTMVDHYLWLYFTDRPLIMKKIKLYHVHQKPLQFKYLQHASIDRHNGLIALQSESQVDLLSLEQRCFLRTDSGVYVISLSATNDAISR